MRNSAEAGRVARAGMAPVRVELTCPEGHQILSLARLPVSPRGLADPRMAAQVSAKAGAEHGHFHGHSEAKVAGFAGEYACHTLDFESPALNPRASGQSIKSAELLSFSQLRWVPVERAGHPSGRSTTDTFTDTERARGYDEARTDYPNTTLAHS